jgi:RNA-directed DNA polymerase
MNLIDKTRPHNISTVIVEAAYEQVRANGGACGIDGVKVEEFAKDAERNLYKIWNRMASGSYFPPAVRAVEIPKGDGTGKRKLGIPTVSDRIAQTVAAMYLEPLVEPLFHKDSYGFRKGRSQKDALTVTRQRCWQYEWVIDLDIKAFFDNLDHDMLLQAVRKHTECKWLLLYIDRWLKAPIQETNGQLQARGKGTPQGGVISPLLANIYLHHAFDTWMERQFPSVPFARYADDIVIHCKTEARAKYVLDQVRLRMRVWKLELHPEKTRIVYCKDSKRKGNHPHTEFDFLGFTFRLRPSRNRNGAIFGGFLPAISDNARRKKTKDIRSWKMQRRTDLSIEQLADLCNDDVRGWNDYYGMFYRTKFLQVLLPINLKIVKWVKRKYRKNTDDAWRWLRRVHATKPNLFVHWTIGLGLAEG